MCLRDLHILKSYVGFPGMKNREERSKHFFDSGPLMEEDDDLAVYEKVSAPLYSFILAYNDLLLAAFVENDDVLHSSRSHFRGSQMTS